MKIKMYCIFSRESLSKMNGIRGKMATQAGHAYLHAFWNALENESHKNMALDYKASDHAYKITLVVDTVDELKEIQQRYKDVCGTSLVTDAGFTVFEVPTTTCLGIGPISEDKIGDDLKCLKTLT